jgi:hypothetical protein
MSMPMRAALAVAIVAGLGATALGQPTPTPEDAARDQCAKVIADSVAHTEKAEAAADEAKRTKQPVPPADATVLWTQKQVGTLWPLTKRYKADELTAAAEIAHDQAANEVAVNKRHVILAYGAMWVIAAAFVLVLWRRQQGLKAQIADLKKDLDAAVKDGS